MSSRLRSSSVGATPYPKKHFTSRAESAAAAALDVRCACQFFQSDSLLPERINPVGSRPSSSLGYSSRPNSRNQDIGNIFEPYANNDQATGVDNNEFSFGIVNTTDYYAESISRPNSPTETIQSDDIRSVINTELATMQQKQQQQRDQSASFVVAGRQSRHDTFKNTQQQQQQSNFIKQRDPSTSSLLRRHMSSQQTQSFDETNKHTQQQPNNLLTTTQPKQNIDNIIKQRDPSTSSLLRRRMSSQQNTTTQSQSFDETKSQQAYEQQHFTPTTQQTLSTDNVIKQRDPSTSSLLRRRISSQQQNTTQSQSFDESRMQQQQNNLLTTQPKQSKDNVIKQRDPSTSSLVRRGLSNQQPTMMMSQDSIEVEQIMQNREIVTKQRDPSTSSLLRNRMTLPQQQTTTSLESAAFANTTANENIPRHYTSLKDEYLQHQSMSVDEPSTTVQPMSKSFDESHIKDDDVHMPSTTSRSFDAVLKQSGKAIMSVFRKRPVVKSELISPTFESSSILDEIDMDRDLQPYDHHSEVDTSMSSVMKNRMNTIEIEQPKVQSLQMENQFSSNQLEQLNNEMQPKQMPSADPTASSVQQEKTPPVDDKPKTVETGLIEALALSVGVITDSTKLSKDSQPIPLDELDTIDVDSRLMDHYTRDMPLHQVQHQSRSPTRKNQDSIRRNVVQPPPSLPTAQNNPPQIAPAMEISAPSELIPRRNMISGFQDRGQIIGKSDEPADVPPVFIKQRDPSTSSMCRKRYSRCVEPKPKCELDNEFNAHTHIDRQQVEPSPPQVLRQKDLHTSTLLQERRRRAESVDTGSAQLSSDKISKTVSFEFDKQLIASAYEKIRKTSESDIDIDGGDIVLAASKVDEIFDRQVNVINDEFGVFTERDHEYEPIGEPQQPDDHNERSSSVPSVLITDPNLDTKPETTTNDDDDNKAATAAHKKLLRSIEIDETDDAIESVVTQHRAPYTEHAQSIDIDKEVEDLEMEEYPSANQERKKSFMENANDKKRHMQQTIRSHAGKLRTKIKGLQRQKSESPKPKTSRKRFRKPEFTTLKTIHMPKINKPDFKRPEFKRPEFTKFKKPEALASLKKSDFKITLPDRPKFSKPDMSKFKIPKKFSSLRMPRKKSLKEQPDVTAATESIETGTTATGDDQQPVRAPPKKRFDFSSTYPRFFDRKKKPKPESSISVSRDDETDDTPPPSQFATVPRIIRKKSPARSSQWTGGNASSLGDTESGQYQHYDSESIDRETSIERRMRLNQQQDSFEKDVQLNIQTEEQKQLADYDEENRAIHEISKLRECEFRQRKPLVHQESDLVSEESNKDLGWEDEDNLRNRIAVETADADLDRDRDRLSTQETQSSGSSSNRRRKGVIEEIDDDEFFLRKKGISQDDIQIGRYISSAIREGLDTPRNALADLGQYDSYYDEDYDMSNERPDFGYDVPPRKPRRVKDSNKSLESEEFNQDDDLSMRYDDDDDEGVDDEYFKRFLPKRPTRRSGRKDYNEDSFDHDTMELPVATEYYPRHHREDDDERSYLENERNESLEPVDRFDELQQPLQEISLPPAPPPQVPRRRKKQQNAALTDDQFMEHAISNDFIPNGDTKDIIVYRTEHEYPIPLAHPETLTMTPTPPITRRSRSQISRITDDDRTSHGAESLAFDDTKFIVQETKEINGYAVIKKEPPPRPPAPLRRKRSTRSLGDRQFFTMQHDNNKRSTTWDVSVHETPIGKYSTIGPSRPPRRISSNSLDREKQPSISVSDVTQYEEIDDFVKSTDTKSTPTNGQPTVVNKMKDRPLPPPPRPPRDRKSRTKSFDQPPDDDDDHPDDKPDRNDEVVRIPKLDSVTPLSSQEVEEIEEIERATQTDPLPDDFCCEEFEITDDMKTIEPTRYRHTKTLEDILKEEQQAEMERARQMIDEQCLTRGLQKFRDSSQKSLSERSRGSPTDRPKTPASRPITPSSAIVVERRTVVPTTQTEATLTVELIDDAADIRPDIPPLPITILHDLDDIKYIEDTVDTEDERIVNEALKRYTFYEEELRGDSATPSRDVQREASPVFLKDKEPTPPYSSEVVTEEISRAYTTHQREATPPPPPSQANRATSYTDYGWNLDVNDNELLDDDEELPPQPPPRRKSSASDVTAVAPTLSTVAPEMESIPEHRTQTPSSIPDPPLETLQSTLVSGGRVHITDLDVENLNVNAIQAGRILVSDLQANALNSQDLECKSSDLVVKSIQLPSGFMDELIERIRATEREAADERYRELQREELPPPPPQAHQSQPATTQTDDAISEEPEQPPPRPPPPQSHPNNFPSDFTQYTIPPAAFYQLRDYSDDPEPQTSALPEQQQQQQHYASPRTTRRRHHHRRRDHSSSSEDEQKRTRQITRSPEQLSIPELSTQLIRACGHAIGRTGSRLMSAIRERNSGGGKDDTQRKETNIGLMILIVIVAVLMMLGMSGDRAVHHHHWDYFNPPGNSGTQQQ